MQEQLPRYTQGVVQPGTPVQRQPGTPVQRVSAPKAPSNVRSRSTQEKRVECTRSTQENPKPRTQARSQSREVQAAADLQLGAEVTIEGCDCRITDALGMGSFGTVWEAEDKKTKVKLAVKEIACWTHNELMNALFERHLLTVFSSRPGSEGPTSLGPHDAKIPALVGHEVLKVNPRRVRLAMTKVPGCALEDFLEERRRVAAATTAAGLTVSAWDRFSEACMFAHGLISQLAPVFERISALAIHRDVNTHNILVDAKPSMMPNFGLVDFGLAVDALCWCSTEDNPETKNRPTRVGVDEVHTWRYLDIAGDCRYWPVSAWTQFLIGWKEIDARPCLRQEYQVQLDQHALGITAMKVFVELLSPPAPKEQSNGKGNAGDQGVPQSHGSIESSDIPNLQMEIWTLLRAWDRYWKRISPVHKKLISTFHHGGDWEVLKQMCENTNFYENIARDLSHLREAIHAAAVASKAASAKHDQGYDEPASPSEVPTFAKANRLFQAMLMLISDGVTPDMQYGPEAWQAIARTLSYTESNGTFNSSELPTASCSSTASTAEAPPDRRKESQAVKPSDATLLPS